ncbi:MAG: ABC transporter permease [Oscillospiraceae bacterium]|nr:ABC transporter permease [Oscillospiraceae bacterium]
MYILQNALKNIARNKGRNILMGAIILVIIVTTVISLIINTASGAIIQDYKTRFGTRVYINPDTSRVSVMSGRQSEQTVPLPVVYAALAGSDCLMSADLSCHVPSVSDTLLGLGESTGGAVPISPGGSFTKFPTMNVKGYTSPERLDDFKNGYRGITSGTFPVSNNECIVSEDFAALNNIKVGDIIDIAQGMVEDNPLSLKVVGIYFDFTANMFGAAIDAPAAINVRNDIITNYETASIFGKSDPRVDTAEYFLKSPDLLLKFESEARAAGLSYDYKVTTDEEAYNRVVGPVLGMAKISFTFMTVVLILGGLILILLAALSIRERKYEVGVLRAMGMKKHRVAFGLIFESLVITAVCLIVGLGIGAAVAQPVSDILLHGQVTAAESNADSGTGMYYAGVQTDSNAKPLTDLDVNLNLKVVMLIILISLLLVSVSSVTGIIYITKYEPIKILMERN